MSDYDRCWNHFDPNKAGSIIQMDYIGNGIFKCPNCGEEKDYSKDVFKFRVKIKLSEGGWVEASIIDWFNDRLKEFADKEKIWTFKDMLQEEITEGERFEDHKLGVFDVEIICFSYQCGAYDCIEYDLIFEILKEEKIE